MGYDMKQKNENGLMRTQIKDDVIKDIKDIKEGVIQAYVQTATITARQSKMLSKIESKMLSMMSRMSKLFTRTEYPVHLRIKTEDRKKIGAIKINAGFKIYKSHFENGGLALKTT